jgi:hypothetical protein
VRARPIDAAAQPSCAFVGKLLGVLRRCTLRLDPRGGFSRFEPAQFLSFAADGCCLRVGVAGFALGADK